MSRSTPSCTRRSAAIPADRLVTERELFSDLPSLRAQIGKIVTRKVDRLSCVRFGSARYSVPNVHIGRNVELRIRDGVIKVVRFWARSSPSTCSFPLVRPPSTTTTTADRGPCLKRVVRPKSSG